MALNQQALRTEKYKRYINILLLLLLLLLLSLLLTKTVIRLLARPRRSKDCGNGRKRCEQEKQ